MSRVHALGLALAASLTTLLAACGGSNAGPPDLAFVSTRDGDYALFGMTADGGSQERLTEERGDPSSPTGLFFQVEPAWSPDGSRIAFASKREGSFDVYSMAADGTEARRLTRSGDDEDDPSWSPDGRRIVFSGGNARDLLVMNADRGGGVRPLVTGDETDTQPAWSPDGRWIAFVRRQPGTSIRELWLTRADGTGLRQLTSLGATSLAPAWAPDSTRIAFSSNVRNVQFEIYVVRFDGGGFRRLTVSEEDTFEPAWSTDGTTIAYAEGGAIYSKASGADPFAEGRMLTDAANNDSSPEWRPTSD